MQFEKSSNWFGSRTRKAGDAGVRRVSLAIPALVFGFIGIGLAVIHAQDLRAESDEAATLGKFELSVPKAKIGTSDFQQDLLRQVELKTKTLSKSLAPLPWEYRTVVYENLPIGFGSLRKTVEFASPRTLEVNDRNVVPLATQSAFERIVSNPDFYPSYFLELGALTQRAVGRVAIRLTSVPDAGWGTGFLVAPTIMLTNNHVIPNEAAAANLELQMNYAVRADGAIGPVQSFEFDPSSLFYTNVDLDFTLIRVRPLAPIGSSATVIPGDVYGVIALGRPFLYSVGQAVNIVQHPDGRPKEVVLRNNVIDKIFGNVIRYTADTEPGSSGSPVFNNSWVLVALHHAGGDKDAAGKWINNEGIRTDRIVDDIRAHVAPAICAEMGL